jgi:hypothetical protein
MDKTLAGRGEGDQGQQQPQQQHLVPWPLAGILAGSSKHVCSRQM